METIELMRVASYAINAIVCFILGTYFAREYLAKRLRASLAWCLGFFLFGLVVLNLIFITTEVTKGIVYLGYLLAAVMVFGLYYGASLLFFREGSIFREKFAALYALIVILTGWILTYVTPVDQIIERLKLPSIAFYALIFFIIAVLFLQVSRRISSEDPRKRTLILVSAAWFILTIWQIYIGLALGEYPLIEPIVFTMGTGGFLLLLYGMTTGKTGR